MRPLALIMAAALLAIPASVAWAVDKAALVERYLEQIESPDANVRSDAAIRLGSFSSRPVDDRVLPALENALDDPVPQVRFSAIKGLQLVSDDSPRAIAILANAFVDSPFDLAVQGITSLRQAVHHAPYRDLSPDGLNIQAPVLQLLGHESKFVRQDSLFILWRLAQKDQLKGDTEELLGQILPLVRDPVASVRGQAVEVLLAFKPEAPEVRKALLESLMFPDPKTCGGACRIIGYLARTDSEIREAIFKSARSDDHFERRNAVAALARLNTEMDRIGPLLFAALEDPRTIVRRQAIMSLAGHADEIPEAEDKIVEMLEDDDESVRKRARYDLDALRKRRAKKD